MANYKISEEADEDLRHLFRAVEDIREGYRRSVYRSHSIYYRVEGDYVEVMRILSKQDTKTLLQEQ